MPFSSWVSYASDGIRYNGAKQLIVLRTGKGAIQGLRAIVCTQPTSRNEQRHHSLNRPHAGSDRGVSTSQPWDALPPPMIDTHGEMVQTVK